MTFAVIPDLTLEPSFAHVARHSSKVRIRSIVWALEIILVPEKAGERLKVMGPIESLSPGG